jgi:para-aminobenzoate synthetase component I
MPETFTLQNIKVFKRKLLHYLLNVPVFCILDTNQYYADKSEHDHPYYHSFDFIAAIGTKQILTPQSGTAFPELEDFHRKNPESWLFGYFGYDLKNELETLKSENSDHVNFPDLFFFIPETLIRVKDGKIIIETFTGLDEAAIFAQIQDSPELSLHGLRQQFRFHNRISKETYLETVNRLKDHIIEGDVYEVSFCQEFYAENVEINPFEAFLNFEEASPQPFGAFMRMEDQYILCASMERYLKKTAQKIISQPIKGTIRRGESPGEDSALKQQLLNDEKERAENVMIVDLVRNDLSRTCKPGTVKVEELFGIYEFPGVYQMISTVTGELLDDKTGLDAIKASFPMGSMTGAPKIKAMEIIEQYEKSKRGVYSGALGYFSPDGDFDFNVVIRTLLYNASKKYLSLHVGSAITYDSDPEKEYEECLVKIAGVLKAI